MRLTAIFARNLRLFRYRSGLSQIELAELSGLNKNYVGKLEREENSPTVDTLEALAAALQTDAKSLISHDVSRD
jgi:transcriptional regulator with XRE-family HTH domain